MGYYCLLSADFSGMVGFENGPLPKSSTAIQQYRFFNRIILFYSTKEEIISATDFRAVSFCVNP